MDHVRPLPTQHFLQSHAQIFQPALIEKIKRAVRPGSVDQRGSSINDQALLVFGPSVIILGWTRLHWETQSDISPYLCLSVKGESTRNFFVLVVVLVVVLVLVLEVVLSRRVRPPRCNFQRAMPLPGLTAKSSTSTSTRTIWLRLSRFVFLREILAQPEKVFDPPQ